MKPVIVDFHANYDPIAEAYAAAFFTELEHKPLDRQWLDEFAELAAGRGPICDLGCGPGQVARYLRDNGVEHVFGVDLSPEMVKIARRLNPDIEFHQGDFRALDIEDNALGGIAAFYSIIHVTPEGVSATLAEWHRVLSPGGWLLVSFHIGDEIRHVDEWFDQAVDVDGAFFETIFIEKNLIKVRFVNIDAREREPYSGYEFESRRAYVFARKPLVSAIHIGQLS